jgi:hypothetical protein
MEETLVDKFVPKAEFLGALSRLRQRLHVELFPRLFLALSLVQKSATDTCCGVRRIVDKLRAKYESNLLSITYHNVRALSGMA